MALFADGWHMATHVAAFVITVGAYALARRHARNILLQLRRWQNCMFW